MIFKVATWTIGLDSRRLDILVRLALPNVYQQRSFCCRELVLRFMLRLYRRDGGNNPEPQTGRNHSFSNNSSPSLRDR